MYKYINHLQKYLSKSPLSRWFLRQYFPVKRLCKSNYLKDLRKFRQLCNEKPRIDGMKALNIDLHPMLGDKTVKTSFDSHYVYHTAWAARVLEGEGIKKHVDIGSHHYFATLVSAFIPTHYYDYRPMEIHLSGLSSGKADLTNLDFDDNSLSSLSCMHGVEHIGLGRYGDPIDPNGDLKAMSELARVVDLGGHLLFVVPVGRPRVCFNAHRIYDPAEIINCFQDLALIEFSVVTDSGIYSRNVNPNDYIDQRYACGMYHFKKTQ